MVKNTVLDQSNIKNLLIKLSLPATVGMTVMATYNLVDMIFVGKGVGSLGIAGLSIVYPVQLFVLAVGLMIGIGGASIISRSIGEKDFNKAKYTIANILISLIILSLVITLAGEIFIDQLLSIFGATDAIFPFAKDYMKIILFGTILSIFTITSNNILRSEGNAKIAMSIMILSSIINIILDYVFIFIFHFGIKGAAFATVIAQAVATIYIVFFIQSGKSILHFEWKYFICKINLLKEIFTIGFSTFARHIIDSILFIIINNSLKIYGSENAIAAFGIVNRLMRFAFMPIFGIAQGVQPIIGYNFGAKRINKVIETIKIGSLYATIFSILGWLVLMIFPAFFIKLFTNDLELIKSSVVVIRIIILALPIVGFQIIITVTFQAVGKAFSSLILSIARQVLFLIPLIIILPKFLGLNGIWISWPISDTISAILTIVIFYLQFNIFKKMVRDTKFG